MKTKQGHTPGPWFTQGGAVYATPAEDDRDREPVKVCQCAALDWKEFDTASQECRVPDAPSDYGDGAVIAWRNADLIAAAPELLAALQSCADYANAFSQSTDVNNLRRGLQTVFERANAATAKATGGE